MRALWGRLLPVLVVLCAIGVLIGLLTHSRDLTWSAAILLTLLGSMGVDRLYARSLSRLRAFKSREGRAVLVAAIGCLLLSVVGTLVPAVRDGFESLVLVSLALLGWWLGMLCDEVDTLRKQNDNRR